MASNCPLIAFLCLAGALLTAGSVVKYDHGCPEDWTLFGTRCFKFFNVKTTWINAEKNCHSHGANLPSIHNAEENAFIVDLIQKATGEKRRTWIGGHDAAEEGEWLWSDGSPWDYANWVSNDQPDNAGGKEHFVEINFRATVWNDLPGNFALEYICATKAPLCFSL